MRESRPNKTSPVWRGRTRRVPDSEKPGRSVFSRSRFSRIREFSREAFADRGASFFEKSLLQTKREREERDVANAIELVP